MVKHLIIILNVAIITACSGSGSTPSEKQNPTFSLTKLNSLAAGTIYTSNLTGSYATSSQTDSSYTGSVSVINQAQTKRNDISVTPRDLSLSLTGGGIKNSITGTSYLDSAGNLTSVEIQKSGNTVKCTPAVPDKLPDTVKIDDSGILSTLTCDDNTKQERNWKTKDGGNGKILVTLSNTTKKQDNTVAFSTDVTYTLDSNGKIVNFKTITTIPTNHSTLTYQSTDQ